MAVNPDNFSRLRQFLRHFAIRQLAILIDARLKLIEEKATKALRIADAFYYGVHVAAIA